MIKRQYHDDQGCPTQSFMDCVFQFVPRDYRLCDVRLQCAPQTSFAGCAVSQANTMYLAGLKPSTTRATLTAYTVIDLYFEVAGRCQPGSACCRSQCKGFANTLEQGVVHQTCNFMVLTGAVSNQLSSQTQFHSGSDVVVKMPVTFQTTLMGTVSRCSFL